MWVMQRRGDRKEIGDSDERAYTQSLVLRMPVSLHTLHLERELENLISQSGGHGV